MTGSRSDNLTNKFCVSVLKFNEMWNLIVTTRRRRRTSMLHFSRNQTLIYYSRQHRQKNVGQKFACRGFFSRDASWECICSFKWSLSWLWLDSANQQGGNWEASRKALEIRVYRWNPEHVFVIVIYCLCHGKKKCAAFCLAAAWA